MDEKQLGLWQIQSDRCPFRELLEDDDNHCFAFGQSKGGYEIIAEALPSFAYWLADVRNVGFSDISARPTPLLKIPPFIPMVRHGSKQLLDGNDLAFVAISLRDIVSPHKLSMTKDIRARFGIGPKSKIMLLCYAKDQLLERIWPLRKEVFKRIAALGFDLVTAVNYSVWLDHPHAERLINLKRSLITFKELQSLEVPTLPHIYWSGRKDLMRWRDWLANNKSVNGIAINLQTERAASSEIWSQTLDDLKFFVSVLDRPLHFLITGPSTLDRIKQLQHVLPEFSLTNGVCARKAASGYLIEEKNGHPNFEFAGNMPKNRILRDNIQFYETILSRD